MAAFMVLTILIALSTVRGDLIEYSIRALEQFFVSFNNPVSVNAFVCWEIGENLEGIVESSHQIILQITRSI